MLPVIRKKSWSSWRMDDTRVFSFRGDHFEEIKTDLSNMYGWWKTIAAADLDGDGKDDLGAGQHRREFFTCARTAILRKTMDQ